MTWQDDIINELYKYYEQDKSTTKDNWVTNPQLHEFIRNTFIKKIYFDPFDKDETLRHFEFLRHIMYTICKYIKNNEYLNFITRILVTILEENGISIEHIIQKFTKPHEITKPPEITKIYKLVVLPELLYYFKDPNDGIMKLSNGSVKKFIQAIVDGEIDKTICEQMEPIINTRSSSYTSSYTSSHTSKNLGEGYYKKTKTRNTRNTNTKYKKRWTKNYKKEQKKEQKKRTKKKNKKKNKKKEKSINRIQIQIL
jgi:hypothetical protein